MSPNPPTKRPRGDSPASASSTKRRRGAPPGNTNAVKYLGLYSSHARAQQVAAYEKLSPDHMQGQMDGLRIFLDRFVRTSSPDPVSHEQSREDLIAYTHASEHLTRLIRYSVYIQSLSQPLQAADDWLAKLLGENEEDTPPLTGIGFVFDLFFQKQIPLHLFPPSSLFHNSDFIIHNFPPHFGTITPMRQLLLCLLLSALLLSACAPAAAAGPTPTPTAYDPFVPVGGSSPVTIPTSADGTSYVFPTPTEGPFIVPTAVPLDQLLPTPRPAGMWIFTPTPDGPRVLPTARRDVEQYIVQPGDSLGQIAQSYGVGLEALIQANGLTNADVLEVGQTLVIPVPDPGAVGSSFKIIPDSELVYGPASAKFDVQAFIQMRGGYLTAYSEEVNGEYLSAAQIVTLVAQNYSVNPRLLLALIDYRSQWVSNPAPAQVDFALNIPDLTRLGLYLQLTYAANELNRGYYLWRANAVSTWVLADGSVVPIDTGINAGTAGVQNLFSKLDDRTTWQADVDLQGLFQTYFFLFGYPFDFAVDPILPTWLHQPRLALPFERGVTWVFTGGPHGGWADGSAWAALDFAPVADVQGCFQSEEWVTALTDGVIIRTGSGQVIQDIDGDGYEQTGWVILYMHVEGRDRVEPGTHLKAGDRIGHPSCEGGLSPATHLHLARKYNGEWIPADGLLPFVLDGWTSSGTGVEYDGYLTRGIVKLEALEGITEVNMIQR